MTRYVMHENYNLLKISRAIKEFDDKEHDNNKLECI